jgi:hypothetical protein
MMIKGMDRRGQRRKEEEKRNRETPVKVRADEA